MRFKINNQKEARDLAEKVRKLLKEKPFLLNSGKRPPGLREVQQYYLEIVYEACNYNKSKTARYLQISHQTLYNLLARYHIR